MQTALIERLRDARIAVVIPPKSNPKDKRECELFARCENAVRAEDGGRARSRGGARLMTKQTRFSFASSPHIRRR